MEEAARRGGEEEELVSAYMLFIGDLLLPPNASLYGKQIQVSLVRSNFDEFLFIHPIQGELHNFRDMTLPELVDEGLLVLPDTATLLSRKYIPKGNPLTFVRVHFWVKIGIERHSVELVSERMLSSTFSFFRIFLDIQPVGTIFKNHGNRLVSERMLTQWKSSRQFLLEAASSASGLGLTPPEHVIKSSSLSDHQKQGLKWMFDREEYTPDADEDPLLPFWEEKNGLYRDHLCDFLTLKRPCRITGGILADEPGMGKTLTLLSLIAYTRKTTATVSRMRKKRRKLLPDQDQEHNPTLVVCPPSVVATWEQQIKQWTTQPGALKYCTYSSSAKDTTNWLMQHDLVLATYDDVNIPDSVLYQVEWWRVILDDAHVFLNLPNSRIVRPLFAELKARRRWAVTGKPVHEDSEHYPLDSIMFFLGLPLFSQWASQPMQSKGLMEILSLRRAMPVKSIQNHMVVLSKYERDIYKSMEAKTKDSASESSLHVLQAAVLHLWMCCNSLELSTMAGMLSESLNIQEISREPELLRKVASVLQEDKDYDCPVCLDQPEVFIVTRCAHIFCGICIDRIFTECNETSSCPMCRAFLTKENIFAAERGPSIGESSYAKTSSKFSSLLDLLVKSRNEDPSKKSIVLTQFQRMLMPVARALLEAGFNVKRLDGVDNAQKKAKTVEEFINADAPVILLATFKALSDGIPGGLDLSADSNVYLIEPCWKIESEREVLCSIHGYWTKANAKVVRLVCKDTIEERVLQIREEQNDEKWLDLAKNTSNEDPTREVLVRKRSLNKGLLGFGPRTGRP